MSVTLSPPAPETTRSLSPPIIEPRAPETGSAARISASVRPTGVQVAVQETPAIVQSMVPTESTVTGSRVTSGVIVQPSSVSGIERSPKVPAYWTPVMPSGSGAPES